MTRKKALHWSVTFALLAAFSVATVSGLFRSPLRVAMAKMAQETEANEGFVVVENDDAEHSRGFLERFENFFERHLICQVTVAQRESLEANYTTTEATVDVNGTAVPVLTVSSDEKLKSKDIRQFLESTSQDKARCQVLKEHNIFYLLFSANVS